MSHYPFMRAIACDNPRIVEDVRIPGFAPLQPGEKICANCDKAFQGRGFSHGRFCSGRCEDNAISREYRQRKREFPQEYFAPSTVLPPPKPEVSPRRLFSVCDRCGEEFSLPPPPEYCWQQIPGGGFRHPEGFLRTPHNAEYCARCGPGVQCCRGCGCTDEEGCPEGCWWVGPGLCSSCGPAAEKEEDGVG